MIDTLFLLAGVALVFGAAWLVGSRQKRSAAARRPRAETRWTAPDGTPYRLPPESLDADYPDVGQHETWKRELRIALWRAAHAPREAWATMGAGVVDLHELGLADAPTRHAVGPLLPLSQDLAWACRRLGFPALAEAAMPGAAHTRAFWEEARAVVEAEAARRPAAYEQARKAAQLGVDPVVRDGLPAEYRATMDPGPFEVPPDAAPLTLFGFGPNAHAATDVTRPANAPRAPRGSRA